MEITIKKTVEEKVKISCLHYRKKRQYPHTQCL
jgi:hypothetical protein